MINATTLVWAFRAPIGSQNEDGSKKFVIRPYTPTSSKDAKGYFDLVVKVYEQGKMSKHFGELKVPCPPLLDTLCCCLYVAVLSQVGQNQDKCICTG